MMGVWDDLEQRLIVRFLAALDGEVKKPKVEDLDRFERDMGFRLPVSYREFALKFGPGTFGRGWQFSTPGFPNAESDIDLAGLNHRFHSQDLYQGFFLFCGKEDFHGWFAWSSKDVTDPDTHEYGIYLVGAYLDGPLKVASTFHEFVMSYALGGGFERQVEGGGTKEPGELGLPEEIGFAQIIE